MFRFVTAVAAAALAFAAVPLSGQERTVMEFSGYTGRQSPRLTPQMGSLPQYDRGWNLGGGATLLLSPYVAFRGEFAFARSRASGPAIGSTDFNRLYGAGATELRLPIRDLVVPYAFAGVGAVRVAEAASAPRRIVTPAGWYGGGVAITAPGRRIALFLQICSWVYQMYGWPGIAGTQRDLAYSGGLRYRLAM